MDSRGQWGFAAEVYQKSNEKEEKKREKKRLILAKWAFRARGTGGREGDEGGDQETTTHFVREC